MLFFRITNFRNALPSGLAACAWPLKRGHDGFRRDNLHAADVAQ
jgi:hypothetical protein